MTGSPATWPEDSGAAVRTLGDVTAWPRWNRSRAVAAVTLGMRAHPFPGRTRHPACQRLGRPSRTPSSLTTAGSAAQPLRPAAE